MKLRKLCFVAGITAEGSVRTLYAGLDADAAREALENAPEEIVEAEAFRHGKPWKRRKGQAVATEEEAAEETVPESGTPEGAGAPTEEHGKAEKEEKAGKAEKRKRK